MTLPGDLGRGDPRVTVAVLDGPVDASHPCLAGAALEFPLGQPAFDVADAAARHGTHVASVIFGRPDGGVAGIAPRCRGLIVPVFAGSGAEGLRCSQTALARAITVALEHGAHIVNISGGQLSGECEPDIDLRLALEACERQRVLVLAAAGNDGRDCGHLPACVPTVVAVGAADAAGRPLALSNWGEAYAGNGLLAEGRDISGAVPGGGVAAKTGTSFATPVASAAAALMLAADIEAGRLADPLAARTRLVGRMIRRDGSAGAILSTTTANPDQTDSRGSNDMSSFLSELSPDMVPASVGPAGAGLAAAATALRAHPGVAASELAPAASQPQPIAASCGGEDCGCGCGGAKKAAVEAPPALVYALGQIGHDFVTEARRDSIAQFMRGASPDDPKALLAHLSSDAGREDGERIVWTIMLDSTPIYAIQPVGAYAALGYERLLQCFAMQTRGETSLFAFPGRVAGSVRLMSGETVPVIIPAARAILPWDVPQSLRVFLEEFAGSLPEGATAAQKKEHEKQIEDIRGRLPRLLWDFRNLVTRKYRNLGLSGRDRALNFASTAAFRVFQVLREIVGSELVLDDVAVTRSPACRPGSDCYDVHLRMFTPADARAALRVFQFTLDVSDTIPVNVGEVSSWSERPRG
jgi:hypothetical protein